MEQPAIDVRGLTKHFGSTLALGGVDLRVDRGEVLGLLGPNGAGKTTLVRILATLLSADEGHARIFGHDVGDDPQYVRETIALTGQFAAVDELLTGRENLRMFGRLFHLPAPEARRRADELLSRFDLEAAADRPVGGFSGGMRRRLDLASSLLTHPPLLFLDEPTTGLDPRGRNSIWAIIRELVDEGTTLLLTTQYLEEADQLADRIAVIDQGDIIAEGTGDELKDRVGGHVVEIVLASTEDRDRARHLLGEVGLGDPAVADGQPSRDTATRLVLPTQDRDDGVAVLARAARSLESSDVEVRDLGLRRPTLDDVFLRFTGRTTADEPEEAAP